MLNSIFGKVAILGEDVFVGVVADFVITAGNHATRWYSRRGGETIGSVSGDHAIDTTRVIDRVTHGSSRLTFNIAGGGAFSEWWNAHDPITIEVRTTNGTFTLDKTALDAVGGGFLRLRLTAAQNGIANTVADQDAVRIIISQNQ